MGNGANTPSVVALILTLAILLTPLAVDAQQAGKVPQIGWLSLTSRTAEIRRVEAFRHGLAKLGYIEGENIIVAYRWAEGDRDRLRAFAADLVRLKVDVIVASGTDVIAAAREATRTIPIVMRGGSDPVGAGLVASLARPGGNITGMTSISVELSGKRLELLREIVPGISRVAVLSPSGSTTSKLALRELEAAGQSLGIQLHILGVRGPGDFDAVFAPAMREHTDALIVLSSPLFSTVGKQIADFATKNRLPGISPFKEFADAGGLIAYGADIPEMSRRAASFVDKILKGAKPADLPVEQPTKLELVINMKAAKALGLTIPPSILMRADEVIE